MTQRTCRKCGYTSDDLTEFRKDSRQKDGRASMCRACSRKDSSERRHIVNKLVHDSKLGKHCEVCGGDYPPVVLDYHHRDPSKKKFGIGDGAGRSTPITAILEEIDKCMLVCANCHRLLHYKEDLNDN